MARAATPLCAVWRGRRKIRELPDAEVRWEKENKEHTRILPTLSREKNEKRSVKKGKKKRKERSSEGAVRPEEGREKRKPAKEEGEGKKRGEKGGEFVNAGS